MRHSYRLKRQRLGSAIVIGLMGFGACVANAQGPTPETGNTIFPGGGLFSYGADFFSRKAPASSNTAQIPPNIRPTLEIPQPLIFGWGIRRDLELVAVTTVITHHLNLPGPPSPLRVGGTGLGDSLLLVKYRFLRLDSARGTTQASIMAGPKLPTGRTNVRDSSGVLLPASLQPGSGSTDLFVNFSGTYTGLFNLEKLVADTSIDYMHRGEGTQSTQLGDTLHSRFFFPYRPYQSHSVGREWWVGPELVWDHAGYDRIAGLRQPDSGGDVLSAGGATYFSPHPGLELWVGIDFAVAQQMNGIQDTVRRHISIGISKQFQLRH